MHQKKLLGQLSRPMKFLLDLIRDVCTNGIKVILVDELGRQNSSKISIAFSLQNRIGLLDVNG